MNLETYINNIEQEILQECHFCRGKNPKCKHCNGKGVAYYGAVSLCYTTEVLQWLKERLAWEPVITTLLKNKEALPQEVAEALQRALPDPPDTPKETFCIGACVTIKREAWERHFQKPYDLFCQPQQIISAPTHPPYDGFYMLAFPYHWWRESDLELAQ